MWLRKDLKDNAKGVLRKNYFGAFGVSIILALAGDTDFLNNKFNYYNINYEYPFYLNIISHYFFYAFITFVLILAFRIFMSSNLTVGGSKYFIQSAQYKDATKCFSYSFDKKNYIAILKTMLSTKILIFLWTLLLIIPGIIKSYAYRMVPYILADNPNIGVKKAIILSNEMTKNHKFDMFVLDLSFLGWYLLGALAFGLGVLFVLPYQNATNAELYLVLRANALKNSLCTNYDLLLY